MTLLLL